MSTIEKNETARVPFPPPPPPAPRDPLAQTFTVPRNLSDGDTDGVFLSKITVYFSSKALSHHVVLEVRETENGVPTPRVLPFGRVVKAPADVNVASHANNAWSGGTDFVFDAPIHVLTEREYCFVVKPGGDSHDYRLHIARLGGSDLATGAPVSRDPGVGVLFLSTNDRTWVAHKDENVKFDLYCRKFETGDQRVVFRNRDYVVFRNVELADGSIGFEGGMTVDTTDQAATPATVSSFGTVVSWDSRTNELVVSREGTASIASGDTLEGYFSSFGDKPTDKTSADYSDRVANASVEPPVDLEAAWFEPRIYRGEYSDAKTFGFEYRMGDDASAAFEKAVFNDRNHTLGAPSNMIKTGITAADSESLVARIGLRSDNPYLSPTIDRQSASIVVYESIINNVTTNEHLPGGGDALAKYVGQTVELSQDAEDLRVVLTGYLPSGTDAHVYARVLHAADGTAIADQYWSKLERIGPVIRSSSDRSDYIEIEYQIQRPTLQEHVEDVDSEVNWASGAANQLTNVSTTLAAGDLVLVTKTPTQYALVVVESVSGTTVTLAEDLDLDTSNTTYSLGKVKEEYLRQAFRDASADIEGIAAYRVGSARYEGFRTFSVKVVLTADDSRKLPSLRDLRVVALDI